MTRSLTLASCLILAACQGETGLGAGTGQGDDLKGTGAYDIIPDGDLVWTGLVPGFTCSKYIRLESVGEESLVIERIDLTTTGDGVFTMSEIRDVTVPVGDAYEFTVQARISSPTSAEGELRITSNDVNDVDKRISLFAEPDTEWDTGDTGEPEC